jgi:hypothetical protein
MRIRFEHTAYYWTNKSDGSFGLVDGYEHRCPENGSSFVPLKRWLIIQKITRIFTTVKTSNRMGAYYVPGMSHGLAAFSGHSTGDPVIHNTLLPPAPPTYSQNTTNKITRAGLRDLQHPCHCSEGVSDLSIPWRMKRRGNKTASYITSAKH